MHFRNLFSLQLIVASYAYNTDIIRDYFSFKNVTRVAGFSCGEIEDDIRLIKLLNNVGIAVSINQLASTIDVPRFLQSNYSNLGVFLDLQCWIADEDDVKLFNETTSHYIFDHLHQWLILDNNMDHTIQLLNEDAFSITTDIVIAVPRDDDYILYDVYNHCKRCGGLLNITEIGTWSRNDELRITLKTDKFSRRWNYHGMKIRIAGYDGSVFRNRYVFEVVAKPKGQDLIEYLQEKNSIQIDNWGKFGYSIMMRIAEMFNFTLEVIELNHWGKNDSNGPLMAGLGQDIYDIGFYPSILTLERLKFADVILQIFPARTCFLFRTVPSVNIDMNGIFRPFVKNVWYMILLLAIIIIFALWTVLKLESNVPHSDYGTTVLIAIAAICQQGLPFFGNKVSSRVVFFQTMIFGLLVYNYYSAAVVSSRLNTPLDKMNDSLYSLIKSGMKIAAYKTVYFNVLLHSPSPDVQYFKKHWDTIPEEKRFCSMQEGIQAITKPGFAYHADPMNAYPFIERIFDRQMICQLTEVHLLRPSTLGLWSSRGSHFNEIIKIGLIRISTSGIRKREVIRWNYRKPYCNKDKLYVSTVTIHEAMPVILLLFFGTMLSVIIYFIENIVFRMLQKKRERMTKPENRLNKLDRKIMIPAKSKKYNISILKSFSVKYK
ncbi:ionotropic receptor 75a [Xylocopa sonorina]|uniref:ionotropic receptor 75a n=1 Tax=Xylocopa sonorina TaxID=1818115 RepID=UPI00403ABBD1